MPTKYIRKTIQKYSSEDLEKAINEYKSNEGSVSQKMIASKYNIPYSTFCNNLEKPRTRGRPTYLSPEEELLLVECITKLGEWGFGMNNSSIRDLIVNHRKANPNRIYANFTGSKDWLASFKKRWSHRISSRVAQNVPISRITSCTKEVIDHFYELLKSTFDENDLLNKPTNIFNCDETGFQCNPGSAQIICRRGSKNPINIIADSDKTSYTILSCCNAAGNFLPPLILYKAKNLYSEWCLNGPEGASYNSNESGKLLICFLFICLQNFHL